MYESLTTSGRTPSTGLGSTQTGGSSASMPPRHSAASATGGHPCTAGRSPASIALSAYGSSRIARLYHRGDRPRPSTAGRIAFAPKLPSLGRYRVELAVTDHAGREDSVAETITLRDLLIVSIGDSFGPARAIPIDGVLAKGLGFDWSDLPKLWIAKMETKEGWKSARR